jgi:hypothetical protein
VAAREAKALAATAILALIYVKRRDQSGRVNLACLTLGRSALVACYPDHQPTAANSTAHRPATTDVAPITTEAGDQHGHVERTEAMPSWTPRADALVGIDMLAALMREGCDKCSSVGGRCADLLTSPKLNKCIWATGKRKPLVTVH